MLDPQDLRVTSYLPQAGHGAGGMSIGMSTSGMIVHHIPSGLGISCDSERSQWANKEKALALLEALLLAIESEKHLSNLNPEEVLPGWDVETGPTDHYTIKPNGKVAMIKEVRQLAGCGLKEAKEAVDKHWGKDNCESLAIFEVLTPKDIFGESCSEGSACVCGGDLPAIREGCYNWKK